MTIQRLRTPALAALASASLFAAGCGSDEDDVKDAVKGVAAAAKDKDADKFCGALSKEALKQVETGSKKKCKEAFNKQTLDALAKDAPDPDKIKFDKVTVKDDTATVKIKGEQSETKLLKEDGEWKITP